MAPAVFSITGAHHGGIRMNEKNKRFDLWPLIVGVIAAIGIIFSPSSGGGITKQPTEPSSVQTTASSGAATAGTTGIAPTTTAPDGPSSSTPLRLLNLTEKVKPGETASITVSGQPDTRYAIEIRLGRNASTASGLEPKTSDPGGVVSWSWRVGPFSERGEYRIVITGGGQTLELPFIVA